MSKLETVATIAVSTVNEKAAAIEKLVSEIMAQSQEGSIEYQFAALCIMDCMGMTGRKSPRKGWK